MTHTFTAKSVTRKHYVHGKYAWDKHFIELPSRIAREYSKGIDRVSLDLSVFGMRKPSIEVKEGDKMYKVTSHPVTYHDNTGTYYWRSKCSIEALDGSDTQETSALIGSGFYVNDGFTNERLCDKEESDVPLSVWLALLVGVVIIFILL